MIEFELPIWLLITIGVSIVSVTLIIVTAVLINRELARSVTQQKKNLGLWYRLYCEMQSITDAELRYILLNKTLKDIKDVEIDSNEISAREVERIADLCEREYDDTWKRNAMGALTRFIRVAHLSPKR